MDAHCRQKLHPGNIKYYIITLYKLCGITVFCWVYGLRYDSLHNSSCFGVLLLLLLLLAFYFFDDHLKKKNNLKLPMWLLLSFVEYCHHEDKIHDKNSRLTDMDTRASPAEPLPACLPACHTLTRRMQSCIPSGITIAETAPATHMCTEFPSRELCQRCGHLFHHC